MKIHEFQAKDLLAAAGAPIPRGIIAASHPDAGLRPFQARRLAFELGFTGDEVPQAERIMLALARVYLDKDCSLAEINPLVVTPKGEVVVLDAKVTFDDNALFRHPDVEKLRDEAEEDAAELGAPRAGP